MKLLTSILTLLVIISNTQLHAQPKENTFFLDALSFYSNDSSASRLDVYVQIPFSMVEFKNAKDGTDNFIANLDMAIDIKDRNGITVYNKTAKEKLTTQKTDVEFLNNNSLTITKNVFLPTGDYKVKTTLYELSTKKYFTKERDVTVRDFKSQPLTISDVMIISKINESGGKKYITPSVSRNISDLDTFNVLFYVYKNNAEIPISVRFSVIDSKNESVYSIEKTIDMNDGANFQNQFLFSVPSEKLVYDKYSLLVSATSSGFTAKENSTLENESVEIPTGFGSIDDLISQLQYIAKGEEMDYMKEGKNDVEKQKRFTEFWKKKDANPNTKKNEVMVEYYKRIRFANEKFGTPYNPGWRSDMGMVYVIYGLPSSVDRHPFEDNTKPYEIWTYDQYNRQYVFVDETGFGDYRLTTPIWDTFRFNR